MGADRKIQLQIAMLEGKGKTMRHMKFFSTDDIDEKKISRLLKHVKKKC